MEEKQSVINAIDYAIAAGYRHIDTAEWYKNEDTIGEALELCYTKYGLKREDIWITNKIPTWRMTYELAK